MFDPDPLTLIIVIAESKSITVPYLYLRRRYKARLQGARLYSPLIAGVILLLYGAAFFLADLDYFAFFFLSAAGFSYSLASYGDQIARPRL